MLRFLLQEFAQQKGLLREPLGTRVLGKKIKKLVPKYRRATWLEHHDWHPGFDLGSKRIQSPQQQFLGPVQHAKVIQWPPATQGCARYCHVKSRRFENVNRRLGGVRMEIVVEGIRPEHDLTWLVWRRVFDPPGRGGAPSPHRRYPPPEPFPECLRANAGIFLCLGIPAILFAISRNKGTCVAKFTSPSATERTRAQTSIFPNAYAHRGRARPS